MLYIIDITQNEIPIEILKYLLSRLFGKVDIDIPKFNVWDIVYQEEKEYIDIAVERLPVYIGSGGRQTHTQLLSVDRSADEHKTEY